MSQTAAQTRAYRAKRLAAGLCYYCPQRATAGIFCASHAERNREHRRAWRKARTEAHQRSKE